jgi:hypothetical protein
MFFIGMTSKIRIRASPRVPNIFFLKTWSVTTLKKVLEGIKKAISKSF